VSLLTTVTVSSLHKNLHLFFYSVHKCRLFLLIHLTNSQKWSGGNFYMKFAQTENCNSHSKSFIVNISEKKLCTFAHQNNDTDQQAELS